MQNNKVVLIGESYVLENSDVIFIDYDVGNPSEVGFSFYLNLLRRTTSNIFLCNWTLK